MNLTLAFGTSSRTAALARARDQRIEWLLGMHPVTAAMLVAIHWFPSKAKALRRLNRLVVKRHIRLAGTVCRKLGRPEHVFCRWQPKTDDLLHEVDLTELCLRLDAEKILRGPAATDPAIRPDAEVWINGQMYYLELDRNTMGYSQMTRRFELHEAFPHFVLWVCPTATRRDGLRLRAEKLRHNALFTTFAEAMADPHAVIWLDFRGGKAALPRQCDRDEKPFPEAIVPH